MKLKIFSALLFGTVLATVALRFSAFDDDAKDSLHSSASSPYIADADPREPVAGYADLHIHMLAEYAYGGAWFHGSHEGPEHVAMHSCSGNGGGVLGMPRDHARTVVPILNEFVGTTSGSTGDTGLHLGKRKAYPNYEGWPRWDTIAHQQVWEGFLRDAHTKGLNLIVLSAVNFKPLCTLMPENNRKYDCEDMSAVERQLAAAHRFVRTHHWAEIALSSEHAREIIRSGKLAIVLAIEVSDLFSKGNWRRQLDHVYRLGVRSIQPVHQLDNRFAGAAPHHFIFKFFQVVRDLKRFDLGRLGFELDHEHKNKKGLTTEGRELVEELMRRKMLVDLAHLSERAVRDTYAIAMQASAPYPLFISHGHFREILDDKKADDEKSTPDWMIELVKRTGGMFGIRTGPEAMKSYGTVPNDCAGSTKSFAQAYQYGDLKLGVAMGFGSDMNGFIQQIRPRFGKSDETCGATKSKSARKRQQAAQRNPLGSTFDRSGFGHIGQITEIVQELRNFGVDTSNLDRSADSFVRMWGRAERWTRDAPTRGLASE